MKEMNDESMRLLLRHIDGTLSAAETDALNERLRNDPAARAWLNEIADQAVAMGDLARGSCAVPAIPRHASPAPKAGWRRVTGTIARWAAVLTVLGSVAWMALDSRDPEILTVMDVDGPVIWTNQQQAEARPITVGERLPSGTVETQSDFASVILQLTDGSTLRIAGYAVAQLSEDTDGPLVRLRGGTLDADIAPQQDRRHLRVRTSTAEARVLGTKFSVSAQLEASQLEVSEGKVAFERLADGESISVGAGQFARATLDHGVPFVAQTQPTVPTNWSASIERATPGSKGRWLPPDAGQPARIGSVPLRIGTQDGKPIMQYGVCIRENRAGPDSFVALTERSVIRLRYRTSSAETGMHLFLITRTPEGRFGGNFEFKFAAGRGADDGTGWRVMELPVDDLQPIRRGPKGRAVGKELDHISIRTFDRGGKLEVAEMEVQDRTLP